MDNERIGAIVNALTQTIESRKHDAINESYVARLCDKGLDTILKKIGEEATETVIAAAQHDDDNTVYEIADLWFHTLVLLAYKDIPATHVLAELERRFGVSGIVEKASRTT